MANFVFDNSLGETFDAPTDVILSDDVFVQPDILFISKERADKVSPSSCDTIYLDPTTPAELLR